MRIIHLRDMPCEENRFLAEHVRLMDQSLRRWSGTGLLPDGAEIAGVAEARSVFEAPFALVSHGTEADPIFNYGNLTALRLFEMRWDEFTRMPSRLSAEPVHRAERQRLMEEVAQKGYVAGFQADRISKTGRRFSIENAVLWNLVDDAETLRGQAAIYTGREASGEKANFERLFERTYDGFLISTDPAKLDVGVIAGFLARSYWANTRPREVIERTLAHSLCFGVYRAAEGAQPSDNGPALAPSDISVRGCVPLPANFASVQRSAPLPPNAGGLVDCEAVQVVGGESEFAGSITEAGDHEVRAGVAPPAKLEQVGFARVVTDYATFAWLCDVFVAEEVRGRSLGKKLVETVLAHPELRGLRRWMLATHDAHELYRRFGFQETATPERWMERFSP